MDLDNLTLKCEEKTCEKGMESHYGFHNSSRIVSDSYGWSCKPCKEKFFKNSSGIKSCTACEADQWSYHNKTSCYDPFDVVYFNHHEFYGIVFLIVSGITVMFILVTMCIFITYRKTPIVTSSDKRLTAIQLMSNLLFAISLPLLFLARPSWTICLLRPIVIGFLLTLSFSITVAKAQKLLFIFQAVVSMDEKKQFLTKASQYFITLLWIIVLLHRLWPRN